jgi:asparagine synthase (glutamine-hydrolysing)
VDGLNTYFVSKVVKEAGLTVALSGVGGDEVFAGYDGFRKALLAERLGNTADRFPHALRKGAAAMLQLMPFESERMRKAGELLMSPLHPYFASRRLFSSHQIATLLADDVVSTDMSWRPLRFSRIQEEAKAFDPVNRASAFELQTYMLSTLLRDTDQMSMAHALEVRVPFLDHRLVEYMMRLPGRGKIERGQAKPLLTAAVDGGIPEECIHRPKRGFELPFRVWLQTSMRAECEASFMEQDPALAAPFCPLSLHRIWDAFRKDRVSWSRVWAIFVLRDWLRRHRIAA